jgi:hypothetical protein
MSSDRGVGQRGEGLPSSGSPFGAQFDYRVRLNEENGLRPNIPNSLDCFGPNVLNKVSLGWFPNQPFSQNGYISLIGLNDANNANVLD